MPSLSCVCERNGERYDDRGERDDKREPLQPQLDAPILLSLLSSVLFRLVNQQAQDPFYVVEPFPRPFLFVFPVGYVAANVDDLLFDRCKPFTLLGHP